MVYNHVLRIWLEPWGVYVVRYELTQIQYPGRCSGVRSCHDKVVRRVCSAVHKVEVQDPINANAGKGQQYIVY